MNEKKEITEVEEQPVKKKMKPRGGNSPVIGDNGLMTKPGDNTKYITVSMQLMKLPNIDLCDVKQVDERLEVFFAIHAKFDMKPTVAGLGMALNGMDRRRLWEIKTGAPSTMAVINKMPPECTDSIKKAYRFMENLWESYMQDGKINPMSGVFLGTNNFGYINTNKIEMEVAPTVNQDADYNADDIKKRYLTDSATIALDSPDSDS